MPEFICPQCQLTLINDDKRWHCNNKHSFDIAKQGYSNLLLVQNKRSKVPGDDGNMVAARQRFLAGGYYAPIAQAINCYLQEHLKKTPAATIIDAGCGEGYYTSKLYDQLTQTAVAADITGIDISKFAVKSAAKRNKQINWFVASSSQLPVSDNSCDVILSLFSPLPEKEFYRCLDQQGVLVVASTGKNHLRELRERLYDEVSDATLAPELKLAERFLLRHSESVQFNIHLDKQQTINDLLMMTPHYWKSSPKKQQALKTLEALTLSVDIKLHYFKTKS